MLSLATPLWLCGLVLLPLIRWLHRGGRHRRAVPVARLQLWHGAEVRSPAAGERRPPDPAWRRRALFAALLFVALAGPQWPQRQPPITLWVDDSLSMLTREVGGNRLSLALARARTLLADTPHAEVELRALGDPWLRLGAFTDAAVLGLTGSAGRREPAAPPAALLRRDSLHWLLTDGADVSLFDWPGGRRPDRVIQVGGVTRNVGLERLSARRNPQDPQRLDLLLKISNGGSVAETRELLFMTAAGEVARSTQRLEAGASVLVRATIPATAQVRATLQPGDALVEDDSITLDLSPLRRRRVAADAGCDAALRAAVSAHPALVLVAGMDADIDAVLSCSPTASAGPLPGIRVVAEHTPVPVRGALQWASTLPESHRSRLDAESLQLAARLASTPADSVLLAIGGQALVVRRAGTPVRIETAIDFSASAHAAGPEVPLLVNLMFESLFDGPLLDTIALTERGPAAVRVAPQPGLGVGAPSPAATAAPGVLDGTSALLLLALGVLLWEIAALGRQWWRLRPATGASAE